MTTWLSELRQDLDHAERLETDLAYFAEQYLKIRTKAGPLASFTFNPAQIELHKRLEEQKQRTGKVRAIVLKARQMGVSTLIAARLYRQTISGEGLRRIAKKSRVPARCGICTGIIARFPPLVASTRQ